MEPNTLPQFTPRAPSHMRIEVTDIAGSQAYFLQNSTWWFYGGSTSRIEPVSPCGALDAGPIELCDDTVLHKADVLRRCV